MSKQVASDSKRNFFCANPLFISHMTRLLSFAKVISTESLSLGILASIIGLLWANIVLAGCVSSTRLGLRMRVVFIESRSKIETLESPVTTSNFKSSLWG